MLTWERFAPSHVGRGGFAPIMRLSGLCGVAAGFLMLFERSTSKRQRLLFFSFTLGGILIRRTSTGRSILWFQGEQARNRYGYAGNGG